MILFNEHQHDFRIEKAFKRIETDPKKVVYFELRYNSGALISFKKVRNTVSKAVIVFQHGNKPPTSIKLDSPLHGKKDQLKLILCPEHREIALYVKAGSHEYAEYFHPKFCKNSRLWAMFQANGGVYGILFDSEKYNMDFGFQFIADDYSPNPFDLMSMGIKPTFKFEEKEGEVK